MGQNTNMCYWVFFLNQQNLALAEIWYDWKVGDRKDF